MVCGLLRLRSPGRCACGTRQRSGRILTRPGRHVLLEESEARGLDLVARHQPRAVIYTFGHTPCWISSVSCNGTQTWSPSPPRDLISSGSPAFTAFVTALVQHCSPAGNCVKDYIKYWEMWNEPDNLPYWTGTPSQLYEMFKPVIPITRNNVPGAIVSTPPMCAHATWMASWMTLENAYGRLSDYYGFHVYLLGYTPEVRMGGFRLFWTQRTPTGGPRLRG